MQRPDLQQLVAQYGRYDLIPTEAWDQYDRDVAAYRVWMRRGGLHASAPAAIGPAEHPIDPAVPCAICGKPGIFGYRDPGTKQLKWFCAEDRLAQHWADARRGA